MEDLQEMKEQIGLLKEKLANQTIVNNRLLRQVTKRNISALNKQGLITIVICLAFTPYCVAVLWHYGFSSWFSVATGLMLLFSALMTYVHHRPLWRINPATNDLLTVSSVVYRLKEKYITWIRVALPIVLFWVSWLLTEAFLKFNTDSQFIFFLGGACLGIVTGGFIGNHRRKKIIHQAEEVLTQIEELKRGEEG